MSGNVGMEGAQWVGELIHSRTNVSPKRLVVPGPDGAQLQAILEAAQRHGWHGVHFQSAEQVRAELAQRWPA